MSTSLLAATHLDDGTSVGAALFWVAVYLLIPVVAARFPATRYYPSSGCNGWARLRRTDLSRPRLVTEILAAGAAATAGSLFFTHGMIENVYDVTTSIPFTVLVSASVAPALTAVFYTVLVIRTTNEQVHAAQSALLRSFVGDPARLAGNNVRPRTEAAR